MLEFEPTTHVIRTATAKERTMTSSTTPCHCARQRRSNGSERLPRPIPRAPPPTPVVDAILDRLPALPAGALVLDLACGTGLPAFVLAQARPELEVLGVDVTPALIDQARVKARENSVRNVRFDVMSVDQLDLADQSMNAAVSHFGLLQEGDVAASGRELARVLAPGAPFSVAAFDDMALNTLMSAIARTLAGHVPPGTLPDFDYLTQLAAPGLREQVLRQPGLEQLHSEIFPWSVPLPSFDLVWQIASGPVPFARAFAALDDTATSRVRSELEDAVSQYRAQDGAFAFPMACRLFWGRK
jgi:ubiquinone/menaquinone biosynthesis C-methylase UbiE